MATYVLRRILLFIPTLLGITVLVFAVMAITPGGVGKAVVNMQGEMNPQERKQLEDYLNRRYGLDKPIYVQYLRWLNRVSPIGVSYDEKGQSQGFGIKWPDLGTSFIKQRPVIDLIGEMLPITLLLNLLALPLVYTIAIGTGIYASHFRGKAFDTISGFVLLALWCLPTIWVGIMLIYFFANDDMLHWFPTGDLHDITATTMPFMPAATEQGFQRGWLLDYFWHLVLPLVCLTYGGFAYLSKLTRSAMLENSSSDFVRTARAKGVAARDVLFRHTFRNSLLPLITVAAHILPSLLGGSIIVESIFQINGMGRLMIEAAFLKDYEIIMSVTLVASVLVLVSYLIADLGYAIADPRVSYE
ncbi:MAG: ABC transporter permease [Phycisphaeraceae bacterium]